MTDANLFFTFKSMYPALQTQETPQTMDAIESHSEEKKELLQTNLLAFTVFYDKTWAMSKIGLVSWFVRDTPGLCLYLPCN